MILLFEEGIRGGITQSVTKYATANNKYMSTYDKNKPSNFIQYLDASGLYGTAMLRPLPTGNFEWVDPNEFDEEKIKNIDIMGQKGYLFEVDIHYPRELWDKRRDLPFFAEIKTINKTKKLVTTCQDKKNYVVHISSLQQGLCYGLTIEKTYKVIQFDQSPWMYEYINLCVNKRKNASSVNLKNFYKLMINAVYGKIMENVRKNRDIKLVSSDEKRRKLVREPNYHACEVFHETFTAIEMRKTEVLINNPIYLGRAILDIIKTIMYDYWYSYLKRKYNDKIKLLYDFYKDI